MSFYLSGYLGDGTRDLILSLVNRPISVLFSRHGKHAQLGLARNGGRREGKRCGRSHLPEGVGRCVIVLAKLGWQGHHYYQALELGMYLSTSLLAVAS
jgi:hypothetical protein